LSKVDFAIWQYSAAAGTRNVCTTILQWRGIAPYLFTFPDYTPIFPYNRVKKTAHFSS
jgi:hypothetical protein